MRSILSISLWPRCSGRQGHKSEREVQCHTIAANCRDCFAREWLLAGIVGYAVPVKEGDAVPLDAEMRSDGIQTAAAQAVVTGPAMQHDCSNDESGLALPQLKVEASWDSHGLRDLTDITVVTQMSPGRCVQLGIRVRHLLQALIRQAASSRRGPVS